MIQELSQEMSSAAGELEEKKISVRQGPLRWLMLIFGCLFLMGNYFCYDNPAVMETTLEEAPYDLKTSQYALLYSVYSIPNMVLPLFGGIFLDIIGIK
jgi:MFS family permease